MVAYSVGSQGKIIKTTHRLLPEAREVLRGMGYSTENGALNALLLEVGRQKRQLEGVGPRTHAEFCQRLGIEDALPPEYRFTAFERWKQKQEAEKVVGLAPKTPEEYQAETEAHEKKIAQEEIFPALEENFSSVLAELSYEIDPIEELPLPLETPEALPLETPEEPPLVLIAETPKTPEELSDKSEKLSVLVALALLYCRSSLYRLLPTCKGRTIEAVERELAVLVDIYAPVPQNPGKRRLKRDLS